MDYSKDPALRERNVKVSGLSKMLGWFKRMAGVVRETVTLLVRRNDGISVDSTEGCGAVLYAF